jgi:hypothetical protein
MASAHKKRAKSLVLKGFAGFEVERRWNRINDGGITIRDQAA